MADKPACMSPPSSCGWERLDQDEIAWAQMEAREAHEINADASGRVMT